LKFLQAVCAGSSGVIIASSLDVDHIAFSVDLLASVFNKGELLPFYFSAPYLTSDICMDFQLKKWFYSEVICGFGTFWVLET